jgi:hypothetical protein
MGDNDTAGRAGEGRQQLGQEQPVGGLGQVRGELRSVEHRDPQPRRGTLGHITAPAQIRRDPVDRRGEDEERRDERVTLRVAG